MAMGEGGMKRKRKRRGDGGSNKAEPRAMEMMCPMRLQAREKAFFSSPFKERRGEGDKKKKNKK